MDLSALFARRRPAYWHRSNRNQITGEAARLRPDINALGVHPVAIPRSKQHHDTSGVRRAVRRGNR